MATLKCKMCGGALKYEEGKTVVECEYCGSLNTIPNIGDEKRLQLFDRANRLRSNCDFDKAFGVYEAIVAEYPEEAEAYWGLILCKYGIEYVDDPATSRKVPTCHRSSFESVFDDPNFDLVMEYCDASSRDVYRDEAKQIEEIRKGIVEISSKEEPYDIFICYKETDDNGDRTIDSAIAQDVYEELTAKNYKVFFSRITLEDKLGQEYEPYIFAALNSAKVMLVFGTSYANFNAVWVKNEWTRFLKLMESNKDKYLIPCFKDIDAYDMPKEFSKLQAQDMGKVGAIKDLVRGVEKLKPKGEAKPMNQNTGVDIQQLVGRMNAQLAEKAWQDANILAESILASDPENVDALVGKLMIECQVSTREGLLNADVSLDKCKHYTKVLELVDDSEAQLFEQHNQRVKKKDRKKKTITVVLLSFLVLVIASLGVYFAITSWIPKAKYNKALDLYSLCYYEDAMKIFSELGEYEDSLYYYKISLFLKHGINQQLAEELATANVGDEVRFGKYKGSERSWLVIAINDTSYCLLSKGIVGLRCFDEDSNEWSDSSLREWLNGEFLDEGFASNEREILSDENGDIVSLLSLEEAEKLTADVLKVSSGQVYWLRTPGDDSDRVANVIGEDGVVHAQGVDHSMRYGVRPVIRIRIGD